MHKPLFSHLNRPGVRPSGNNQLARWQIVACLAASLPLLACQSTRPATPPSAPAAAITPTAISPTHPLVGTWRWSPPGKACMERWQYRVNGTRISSGAGQTAEGDYRITPQPSLLGFYRLTDNVVSSNGQPDCWGESKPETLPPATQFIQFSPAGDLFIVCQNESLRECYGPVRKSAE